MRTRLLLPLLLFASSAAAQTVVMGRIPASLDSFAPPYDASPMTVIDLSHPATVNGTISSATVEWGGASGPCSNAFRVRVFRKNFADGFYLPVSQRGPFATTAPATTAPNPFSQPLNVALVTVTLDPPIAVQAGDFIGVTLVAGLQCGGPATVTGQLGEAVAVIRSDFANGGDITGSPGILYGYSAGIRASTAPQALVGIIPVVGATPGQQGAQFKTSFQITNPSWLPESTATFVYHPAGQAASANDPRVTIPLAALGTSSTTDLLAKLNVTGIGSMDVYTTGESAPLVAAHVFNDTGNGTNGFFETLMTHEDGLKSGVRSYVVPIPPDLTNYRVNVGVRSLSEGATIARSVVDASGTVVANASPKSYPPDYFEQVPLSAFVSSSGVVPGGAIILRVTAGSAIVYTSITDNRTNDSAIAFVKANPE